MATIFDKIDKNISRDEIHLEYKGDTDKQLQFLKNCIVALDKEASKARKRFRKNRDEIAELNEIAELKDKIASFFPDPNDVKLDVVDEPEPVVEEVDEVESPKEDKDNIDFNKPSREEEADKEYPEAEKKSSKKPK